MKADCHYQHRSKPMKTLEDIQTFRMSLARMAKALPEIGIEAREDEEYFGFIPYMIMEGVVDVLLKGNYSEDVLKLIVQELVTLSLQSDYLENMVAVCFLEKAEDYEGFHRRIQQWLPKSSESNEQ